MQRRRPLPPEKLGEKGESRFKELCTDAALTANKVIIDEMGWDYLVEFPYLNPNATTPLDRRPHPIECKVQVKTIWEGKNRVSLKLSAAERLAKAALPSFIVVLSVSAQLNFVAMHVFHMLDGHLEHVLKRLRQAEAENGLRINHIDLNFVLRNGLRVTPDGTSLRRVITDALGESNTAYHEKKQQQLQNLGFGRLRIEGKFTVRANSESEMAELFLGRRSAELVAFETNEIRFGIALPSDAGGAGIVKFIPRPATECKMIVKGRSGSPFILPGTLYLSAYRNETARRPYRIETALLDFVIIGNELKIDFRPRDFITRPVTMKDLLATLMFHSVAAGGVVGLTVLAGNKTILVGEVDIAPDEKLSQHTVARIPLVEMMAAVLKAAGVPSQLVSFSSIADRSVDLMFLDNLIHQKREIPFNPITFQPDDKFEIPLISEALLVRRVEFSEFSIAYYCVMDVAMTRQSPYITLNVTRILLRNISMIDGYDSAFEAYCEEARLTTGVEMTIIMNTI